MKKTMCLALITILIAMAGVSNAGQSSTTPKERKMENIKLLQPKFDDKITLYDAFKQRQSNRSFSTKQISDQDLSNLLWSAAGINRSSGKRTVPLLGDIAVYVAMDSGVYLYNAENHELEHKLTNDIRSEISPQSTVKKAPVVFIFTLDDSSFSFFMRAAMKKAHGMDFYHGNQVAYSTQNIYLYACSNNMNSVVIGQLYSDKIDKMLGFKKSQKSYLLQLVGYKP